MRLRIAVMVTIIALVAVIGGALAAASPTPPIPAGASTSTMSSLCRLKHIPAHVPTDPAAIRDLCNDRANVVSP